MERSRRTPQSASDIALIEGSTFAIRLFGVTVLDVVDTLAQRESLGWGWRTAEGFGAIRFWPDPPGTTTDSVKTVAEPRDEVSDNEPLVTELTQAFADDPARVERLYRTVVDYRRRDLSTSMVAVTAWIGKSIWTVDQRRSASQLLGLFDQDAEQAEHVAGRVRLALRARNSREALERAWRGSRR